MMAEAETPTIALRAPDTVMKLARLGAFHQTRLSFMRQLLRRMKAEQWRFEERVFDIDTCLLYTSPSPRDRSLSRMPSSA